MSNLSPNQGSHFISLSQAVAMTTLYRQNREGILASQYQGQGILPLSETFGREAFDALLQETGCEAVRIYGGMDENLQVRFVIVAVNAQGEDILPAGEKEMAAPLTDPKIVEDGIRCPTNCPLSSPLNTP